MKNSADQGQDSPIQTSCSVNNMFIIWQKKNSVIRFNVTGLYELTSKILHFSLQLSH